MNITKVKEASNKLKGVAILMALGFAGEVSKKEVIDSIKLLDESILEEPLNKDKKWNDAELIQFAKECMSGGYPESLLMVWNHEV